ncbi:hypothetical protein QT327_10690 [Olivibacter sp. 47]|uniref:hypothetical protein n=1 Tax=Olivibacter sp. 47 TaxID=3056486 RepID=UPI0025A48DA5|nr:hypothetical protein [Olivibacter sp. 47]MDM8174817.1 hypothetical protein [Olivibacter sp. 47]
MNKEELLQKIKDEVSRDQGYLGIDHLIELSSDKHILKAFDEVANSYAIAMCEEQKRQDVNSCRDRGIYFDPSIILKTKNVAE